MAKVSAVAKNKRREIQVKNGAAKRARIKAIATDKTASMEDRWEAQLKLAELPRDTSKSRLRNRCNLTGRPRGYYRKLGLSRIALRDLASRGQIPGMIKSSW
jgi:small subunit ribosomal protein S14